MGYKKIMIFCVFLLANLAFTAPVNEANKIIDIQQRQLEQESQAAAGENAKRV